MSFPFLQELKKKDKKRKWIEENNQLPTQKNYKTCVNDND